MKLNDLFKKIAIEDILKRMTELYPSQNNEEGYRKAYSYILKLKPLDTSDITVCINHVKECSYEWEHVNGETDLLEFPMGLQFMAWNKWLASEINQEALDNYGELDTVTHCLWEMTFNGFDEETIQNSVKEMDEDFDA